MTWATQKAVYGALTGDAALMARITGVYDQTPQAGTFPYLVIGDGVTEPWDADTEEGSTVVLVVHAWDRSHRGRKAIKEIQGEVRRILHRQKMTVEGSATVGCDMESTDSFMDADGMTFHGVQRFSLTIETIENLPLEEEDEEP